MNRIYSHPALILLIAGVLILSSCATSREYRKKKRNCNCPKWGEVVPALEVDESRVCP